MTTKLPSRPPPTPAAARSTDGARAEGKTAPAVPAELQNKVRETVNRLVARDGFAALVNNGAPILQALGLEPSEPSSRPPRGPLGFSDGEEG